MEFICHQLIQFFEKFAGKLAEKMFEEETVYGVDSQWTNKDGMDCEGLQNREETPDCEKYETRVAKIERILKDAREVKEAEEAQQAEEDEYRDWTCCEKIFCGIKTIFVIAVMVFIIAFCVYVTYYLIFKI